MAAQNIYAIRRWSQGLIQINVQSIF